MSEQTPQYNFGDLVKVNGYYPRIFQIDGKRTERWQYPDEDWTVIVYELYDVANNDWVEAEESDLTLVVREFEADDYLAANPAPMTESTSIDLSEFIFGMGATTMAKKEPAKPSARELSAQEAERRKAERKERAEKIDDLLDQRNWYQVQLERTNNEEFGDRVFAIDAKIKELVEDEK
ncbi:hypothetical protein DOE78_19100 [Bacillus sp. Y1]|nr:hypothetical protein [Bacillus sp. Y1]AYA77388.1 hypothetical protein DOE78_19100 [Bacillus sp. Y1]